MPNRDYGRSQNGQQQSFGPLLGAAAVGFAAGLAATVGRKLAIEATTAVQGDWVDALKAEHRLLLQAFDRLMETAETDQLQRGLALMKIKALLAKHALEEENVIYPALRMHGRDSEGRHLSADHADMKTYLAELEMLSKEDPNWMSRLRDFHQLVQAHIREEEDQIFPAFRDTLSAEQNTAITLKVHREGIKLA